VVKSVELPLNYTWNFGDGTSASGTINTDEDKYRLEAIHTYPDSSDGTPFTATLTVNAPSGYSGSDQYRIVVKTKALDIEVNVAIDDGLWYLHKQQQRSSSGGLDSGQWTENGYEVSNTSCSVLAFEVQGHRVVDNADEDPYVETVQRGLNFLFSKLYTRAISGGEGVYECPYGNPDTNGNGLGIDSNGSSHTYEIGMAMMAIAASGAPDWVAQAGPDGVAGRTYKDILTDMVDMCAWGQNDYDPGRGGWRYDWNYYDSDNSVTQWPAIGLEAAEKNWDIQAPDFVKRELDIWLTATQCSNGGFGYASACDWVNMAKTGAGIAGLNYTGAAATDTRIQNALKFLDSNWSLAGGDGIWDNWYGMYDSVDLPDF